MLGGQEGTREARATYVTATMKRAVDHCRPDPRFSPLFGKGQAHLWARAFPAAAHEEWMRNLHWEPRTCLQMPMAPGSARGSHTPHTVSHCPPQNHWHLWSGCSQCLWEQELVQFLGHLLFGEASFRKPGHPTACHEQGATPTAQCSSTATRMG